MSRLRFFLRCVGEAVCAKGVKALCSLVPMGEAVFEIAEDAYKRLREGAEEKGRHDALAAAAAASAAEARQAVSEVVAELRKEFALPPQAEGPLAQYLERVPSAVRQSLRRPEDPSGKTVPPAMTLTRPEQLAAMLPARLPRFAPGDRPAGVGNWELVELLGAGGFGEVWKAKHPTLAGIPPVALKFCLDPAAASALRHEAALLDRVMQQGTHPGIVPLRQAYLDADPICLEYEFVSGGELGGLVGGWHKGGKPPLKQANATLAGLAKIVAHAHALTPPIVHRDLKPANVLVHRTADDKVRLRVADFGIGGVAQAAAPGDKATSRGGVLATSLRGSHTPLYASPQQTRGDAPDPRDDVHALGVIWYQMLTGDLSSGVPAEWMAVLEDLGQPAELVRLLGECVTSRAEKRVANAGVLAARLEAASRGEAAPEPAAAEREASPPRVRKPETARPLQAAPRTQKVPPRRDPDEDDRPRPSRATQRRAKSSTLPLIFGGAFALVLGLALVVGLLMSSARKRSRNKEEFEAPPERDPPAEVIKKKAD